MKGGIKMKDKLSKKLLGVTASILTLFALSTAVSACFWVLYQPEEPKCLIED
ncbi:cyclic lactone autoinducer peptide [Clostridium acidisoli DSM 12555]|uniref:Cyclic lactone autoinducer peptide n=1 Tax=Clostridium acidisoli DSM 12555 TaxID=1121291 RepID=A0A1W1XKQ3_9CLOT|nr:cyclic lactone autoinducer peptide [Clostridium acidisoli DSM 12555]